MWWWSLVACASGGGVGDDPSGDADTGDLAGYTCPTPAARPDPHDWALTGEAAAGGLATLTLGADGPVYAGSALSGLWRLGALDDPEFLKLGGASTSHTLGDLVVDASDPTLLYRSAGGTLHRSDNAGDTWVVTTLGVRDDAAEFPGHVYGIGVVTGAPGVVYALLDTGVFAASADRGDTWEARGLLPVDGGADSMVDYYRRFRILGGATLGDPVLVHDGRNVYRSDDAGWSWTAVRADAGRPTTFARDPSDPDEVVVDGARSHDGGSTWTDADAVDLAWWGDALYTVVDDVLTVDGAEVYALPTLGTTGVVGAGAHVYAADDTHLWHSADGGVTWTWYAHSNVETNFSVVVPDPHCVGVVWAGTRCDSGVYRSVDWGTSWVRVPTHGHYVMDIVFDPAVPGTVWLVNDDMLMRSVDGGATWSSLWTEFHFHGFALDPEAPGRMLLGSVGSGDWADTQGQVYVSTDDGQTFAPTAGLPDNEASAHSLLFLPDDVVLLGTYKAGDASHLFGAGLGVWRSTDRGLTWAQTLLPSADVATVRAGPDATWAATGTGVFRTDDGGQTWALVLAGTHRWVDFAGDGGLALAIDGSVWRSQDAGDTWTLDRPPEDPPEGMVIENPLARVAWAPWAEADGVAWWTRYGAGIERKVWAAP